jgi:hypothetical protein
VSPVRTGTAACAMIGPSSMSGVTKCTVQPCTTRPGLQRAAMGVEALEQRQQGRVDVDHPPAPLFHELV